MAPVAPAISTFISSSRGGSIYLKHACENKRCVNIEHLECFPQEKHTKHHTATNTRKVTARTETYRRCIAREDTSTIWNSSAGMELLKEETKRSSRFFAGLTRAQNHDFAAIQVT